MDYNYLGQTGLHVSQYILGTMTFGHEADASESKKMFHLARDRGINFFDTANVYTGGRSEEILGDLIKDCRQDVVVATKAYFPIGKGPNDRGGSRYHLIHAVEASLKRLKTDHIDVFYLHRFDEQTPLEETLRAVEFLVQSGKILHPAVSNFSAWQMVKALGIADKKSWSPICAIQPMYNLVKRQAEVEIFPAADVENLAVLPYNPLAGGLLTGKYFSGKADDASRLNAADMYRIRNMTEESVETAKKFVQFAK
jgi:aryl-alcohol dehydrogenase-like predicted oxidoreductase